MQYDYVRFPAEGDQADAKFAFQSVEKRTRGDHAAYFEHYPNVWRHGDWAEITSHGGMIIYGRSDTTLGGRFQCCEIAGHLIEYSLYLDKRVYR